MQGEVLVMQKEQVATSPNSLLHNPSKQNILLQNGIYCTYEGLDFPNSVGEPHKTFDGNVFRPAVAVHFESELPNSLEIHCIAELVREICEHVHNSGPKNTFTYAGANTIIFRKEEGSWQYRTLGSAKWQGRGAGLAAITRYRYHFTLPAN